MSNNGYNAKTFLVLSTRQVPDGERGNVHLGKARLPLSTPGGGSFKVNFGVA